APRLRCRAHPRLPRSAGPAAGYHPPHGPRLRAAGRGVARARPAHVRDHAARVGAGVRGAARGGLRRRRRAARAEPRADAARRLLPEPAPEDVVRDAAPVRDRPRRRALAGRGGDRAGQRLPLGPRAGQRHVLGARRRLRPPRLVHVPGGRDRGAGVALAPLPGRAPAHRRRRRAGVRPRHGRRGAVAPAARGDPGSPRRCPPRPGAALRAAPAGPTANSDLLLGGLAAFAVGPELIRHDTSGPVAGRVALSALALVLVFGALLGSSALLPEEGKRAPVTSFLRYLLIGGVGTVLVPCLGRVTRLTARAARTPGDEPAARGTAA